MPARFAAAFTMDQIALGVIPSPQIFPPDLLRQKIAPPVMPAAVIHTSTARFARLKPELYGRAFLCRSGQQLPSAPRGPTNLAFPVSTSSARRRPQPRSNARIARSRLPRTPPDVDPTSKALD